MFATIRNVMPGARGPEPLASLGFRASPRPEARHSGEQGAALVTVLLFMVLVFILITSMLTVTGNEIAIAGLQRDGMRAMELAQGAIQEAIRRVEGGRPYTLGFTSALASTCPATPQCVTVTIVNHHDGTGAAYLELRADASVGCTATPFRCRSTRRLSTLVLAKAISYPPNITFAASVSELGSADITCGDAYARTFLQYKNYPSNSCEDQDGVADGNPPEPPNEPKTLTYAGWRVSKDPGVGPCYTNVQCAVLNAEAARWYPGTRLTSNPGTRDPESLPPNRDYGSEILTWANGVDMSSCPGSPPTSGTVHTHLDYVPGDKFASYPYANQLVSDHDGDPNPAVPLYGFEPDGGLAITAELPCGLPYQWVRRHVTSEDGVTSAGYWWFKMIIFEQWLDRYWYFDEAKLEFKKGADLVANPVYGAVPPFPDFGSFTSNYDCKLGPPGGTLNTLPQPCTLPDGTSSSTDLGTAAQPKIIVLEGDWTINGTISGYGTIIINGEAVVNGTFDYWGTIVVNGTLQAGTGNVNVHGGLVAEDTLRLIGNITVEGGSTVGGTPPAGPANVLGRAWWERQ